MEVEVENSVLCVISGANECRLIEHQGALESINMVNFRHKKSHPEVT